MSAHDCPACLSDWTAQIDALPELALTLWSCNRCGEVWWEYDWNDWEEETT